MSVVDAVGIFTITGHCQYHLKVKFMKPIMLYSLWVNKEIDICHLVLEYYWHMI